EIDGDLEHTQHRIEGAVELSAECVGDHVYRVTVRVLNLTPLDPTPDTGRDEVLLRSLASAHVVLQVRGGGFVSLCDPPAQLRPLADGCRNVGVWPALVGEPGRRDAVLAAPVILPDYPRIAPESPGD